MNRDYLISNNAYDLLKRVVTIILPGLGALYAALAVAWDWSNTDAVLATLAAFAVFGGVLMKFSDNSYKNSEGKYDGVLAIVGHDPDTGIPNLQLTVSASMEEVASKDSILLKSVDRSVT